MNRVDLARTYLASVREGFAKHKRLADGAVAQMADAELGWSPNEESNSVAVLLQHLGGNMVSRWTDFLTADGEKPDRDRDAEFVAAGRTRAELLRTWERGWAALFATLDGLSAADLERTITIRGEPHSAVGAIQAQLTHVAYHVGQIVYLAKQVRDRRWQTLSIPRGQSRQHARAKLEEAERRRSQGS